MAITFTLNCRLINDSFFFQIMEVKKQIKIELFKRSNYQLLFIFLLISMIFSGFCNWIFEVYNIDPKINYKDPLKNKLFLKFIVNVLFAPFIETIIFSLLPFLIFKLKIKSLLLIILALSFIFACVHTYSIYYMVFGFFSGILLNTFFIITYIKHGINKAILFTFLYHSSYNFIAFIINNFSNLHC